MNASLQRYCNSLETNEARFKVFHFFGRSLSRLVDVLRSDKELDRNISKLKSIASQPNSCYLRHVFLSES